MPARFPLLSAFPVDAVGIGFSCPDLSTGSGSGFVRLRCLSVPFDASLCCGRSKPKPKARTDGADFGDLASVAAMAGALRQDNVRLDAPVYPAGVAVNAPHPVADVAQAGPRPFRTARQRRIGHRPYPAPARSGLRRHGRLLRPGPDGRGPSPSLRSRSPGGAARGVEAFVPALALGENREAAKPSRIAFSTTCAGDGDAAVRSDEAIRSLGG